MNAIIEKLIECRRKEAAAIDGLHASSLMLLMAIECLIDTIRRG